MLVLLAKIACSKCCMRFRIPTVVVACSNIKLHIMLVATLLLQRSDHSSHGC